MRSMGTKMWMPKNVRPLLAMLLRAASGDLNCGLKFKNPVSKPA